ncbi:hypothetical protein L2E82_47855 [Cichorium intybus]|uniref:Uncharacterized protein n=1 Tax=Cichorium intybus TaxID=13427 RepID=A0ACB8YWP4_CICIN|nr:hypothetical protein L2E82_47855 [Cichorium intybus]
MSPSSDLSQWTHGLGSNSEKWSLVATRSSTASSRSTGFRKRRILALDEGTSWQDPPIVKESPIKSGGSRKPPLSVGSGGRGGNSGGWDSDWGDSGFNERGFESPDNMRRNQTMGDLRTGGSGGGMSASSRSTDRN